MKKKIINKITVAALLLSFALAGVCFMPVSASKAEASGEVVGDLAVKVVEYTDYSDYQGKVPRYSGSDSGDYIFAGWFKDEACTTVVESGDTSAYAKFVSADILSVACQVQNNTTAESSSTALRMLSTVDSLHYNEVGFVVETENGSNTYSSTKVYKKVTAYEGGLGENEVSATCFDSSSDWFFALTILNIGNSNFENEIRITPYWVTLDGTTVEGISRYVRVEDYYNNYINVPVRLNSADFVDGIAAGYLEVNYPAEKCSFVAPEAGETLDLGMFEEMEYNADTSGTIKLVGNVSDISGNKVAEGLYVNLRFKVTAGNEVKDEEITVTYNEDDGFCDIAEEIQLLSVARSAYNDFKNK